MGKNDDAFFVSSSSSQDKFLPHFYLHFYTDFTWNAIFLLILYICSTLVTLPTVQTFVETVISAQCLKGQLTLCLKWKQKIIVISVSA